MTSTAALIQLFKEQLENQSAALAAERGVTERGGYLQAWYLTHILGLDEQTTGEVSCDGPNDLGIDAVWIDPDGFVHFFQFKNPERTDVAFPTTDVDKVLSGLAVILNRRHQTIANDDLRSLVEDIYQSVPSGYRLHLVTSGTDLNRDARTKLDSFIANLSAPEGFFTWELEDITVLQDRFYQKSLPTVEQPIELTLEQTPYTVRSADHDSYLFHLRGEVLAELYERHREQLLQQNIRVYQGDRATNAVIRRTCSGPDSARFFHYNNGITFLCEQAGFDPFTRKLTLTRAQVVNGGQTLRVLHAARGDSALRPDVLIAVRAITSQGNKDFANNVAVNLNNQNRIEPSFLRSNDPRIIQLANSLASQGWYLERRENEVGQFSADERAAAESRIGRSLEGHVITLKEGMQAYVATFMRQPELAKKNPKRIFLGAADGGSFDRVFSGDVSAEKVIAAQRLAWLVDEHIRQFMTRKRRRDRVADWKGDYSDLLGAEIVAAHGERLNQAVPQSAVFLTALLYEQWVRILARPLDELLEVLESGDRNLVNNALRTILDLGAAGEEQRQSWPTLLKSQAFFDNVASYMRGRDARAG